MKLTTLKRSIGLGFWFGAMFYTKASLALPPPSQGELCKVSGTVIAIEIGNGSDETMKPLSIPLIKLKISASSRSGIQEPSFLDCGSLVMGQIQDFRNCDHVPIKPGQKMHGIAGRSKGGGPHCIENIKILP